MNEIKKLLLGLTASTIVLTNVAGLPSRAQADLSDSGPEQTVEEEMDAPDVDGPEGDHTPWAEKLGLSDDQMEKLVSLKSDYMVKTAAQKAEFKADMKKMMLLMTAPQLDKEAVMSLHEKMNSIKSDLCAAKVSHMLSAMEVLTAKQRADVRHEMLVHMSSPHHGMHHPKWHHHG